MDNETSPTGAEDGPALLRVARGNPTAEELAALTAVVLSLAGDRNEGDAEPATATRAELLRRQSRRGRQLAGLPGSWRSGRF